MSTRAINTCRLRTGKRFPRKSQWVQFTLRSSTFSSDVVELFPGQLRSAVSIRRKNCRYGLLNLDEVNRLVREWLSDCFFLLVRELSVSLIILASSSRSRFVIGILTVVGRRSVRAASNIVEGSPLTCQLRSSTANSINHISFLTTLKGRC